MLNIRLKQMTAQPVDNTIKNSDLLAKLVFLKAAKPVNITKYTKISQTISQAKTIINPITGKTLDNTSKTRSRVNKAIEKYNNSIQNKVDKSISNVKAIKNTNFIFDKPNMRVIPYYNVYDQNQNKLPTYANMQIVSGVITGKPNNSVIITRFVSGIAIFEITSKSQMTQTESFNYTISAGNNSNTTAESISIMNKNKQRFIQNTLNDIMARSGVLNAKYIKSTNNRQYENSKIIKLEDVRMKDFKVLNLDGEEIQLFNTNQGKCVIDFMRCYYSKPTYRLKKKLESDYLNDIWYCNDWDVNGISCTMIRLWCVDNKIPMIAMDIDNNKVNTYFPESHMRNKDAPSFVYRIHNDHIYPILDKKLVKSFSQIFSENNTSFNTTKKDIVPEVEKTYNIINVENVPCDQKINYLVNKMYESNTEVISKNMSFNGENGNLEFFIIGDNKYMFVDNNTDIIKTYCRDNNIKYTGQSPAVFAKNAITNIKKSQPNAIVNDILLTDGVKNRIHLGLVDNNMPINIETDLGYDINKCYAHCIKNPYEKFMILNFSDNWVKFNGDIKLGLYYIQTNDYTLLHGDNIYSTSMVKYALEKGIITNDNITYALYASDSMEKNSFNDVYEKLDKISNGNNDFKKLLGNIIPGLMGKTASTKYKKSITTSINEAFNNVSMQNFKNIFITNNTTNTNKQYYIYGTKEKTHYKDHNLPLWIQILDDSNIRLHKMGCDIGGEIIYRKTDYLVIRNPINNILGNQPGEYKSEKLPIHIFNNNNNGRHVSINWDEALDKFNSDNSLKYNHLTDINNSNQHQDIINYLNCSYPTQNRSIQLRGMGGVGKSHLIKNIINSGLFKHITCAYTNMASENINGVTINKMLGMDISNKISKKQLIKIGKQYNLIIIDEISMVPSTHWSVLYDIYKYTDCKFLLVGDWNQIPPIENFVDSFYKHHPIIMKMSGYTYCELLYNENSRCDKRLHDVVIQDNIDLTQFGSNTNTNINICYYNKTRKEINTKCMLRNRGNNYTDIPVKEDNGEDCQDASIFVGCPVIYRKSDKELNIIKNKRCTITSISNGKFTVDSISTFNITEFHELFNIGYCFTVHKFQGQTIDQPFTIYNTKSMDHRLIYTALTRSRKYEYINIAK